LFVLLAGVFLIVNRGAYKGYFQDDELDNISWTRQVPLGEYAKAALTPRFETNNFRPVGHFYFREGAEWFGLDFPKYVVVIHAIHLLNVWLVWILLRRLGIQPWAAAAACVFFALHMALFDALWKPMYVFDLLCATFCLASILLFTQGRWILSFAAFWLAYKSKELAIMLPAVLACYELWFGKRRWKVLIPFFLVSLSFGLQGLLLNPNHSQNNDYTFRFSASALARTSVYYSSRIFLIPYLGVALPVIALWMARNRRTWFGLATMGLFLSLMLFLPGRLSGAYGYLAFTGLAIVFASLAEASRPVSVAVFFLLWLPVNYASLREQRRATLAHGDLVRVWVTALEQYKDRGGGAQAFVYSGEPAGFHWWGVAGAVRYLFPAVTDVYAAGDPVTPQAFEQRKVAVLTWRPAPPRLDILTHTPGERDASYLEMNEAGPIWQLDDGWYGLEGNYRWIAPSAGAHLWRPAGARHFVVHVNVGPELLAHTGTVSLSVSIGNEALEPRRFAQNGWQEGRWELQPAAEASVMVRFTAPPGYRPPGESRNLGIAIGSFGFQK